MTISLIGSTELQPGDRLLSKPYRKTDLAQALRGLLDQRAP